jgi:hypothetical protein
MPFLPVFNYFLLYRYFYSLQHPVLENSQSAAVPQCEKTCIAVMQRKCRIVVLFILIFTLQAALERRKEEKDLTSSYFFFANKILRFIYFYSFPEVKRPGGDVDHPPPRRNEVKVIVEQHIYSRSAPSWPVMERNFPLRIVSKYIKLQYFLKICYSC